MSVPIEPPTKNEYQIKFVAVNKYEQSTLDSLASVLKSESIIVKTSTFKGDTIVNNISIRGVYKRKQDDRYGYKLYYTNETSSQNIERFINYLVVNDEGSIDHLLTACRVILLDNPNPFIKIVGVKFSTTQDFIYFAYETLLPHIVGVRQKYIENKQEKGEVITSEEEKILGNIFSSSPKSSSSPKGSFVDPSLKEDEPKDDPKAAASSSAPAVTDGLDKVADKINKSPVVTDSGEEIPLDQVVEYQQYHPGELLTLVESAVTKGNKLALMGSIIQGINKDGTFNLRDTQELYIDGLKLLKDGISSDDIEKFRQKILLKAESQKTTSDLSRFKQLDLESQRPDISELETARHDRMIQKYKKLKGENPRRNLLRK